MSLALAGRVCKPGKRISWFKRCRLSWDRDSFYLCQIYLLMIKARVGKAVDELAVICQQEQTFAVIIESTGGIYPGDREKIAQCKAPTLVGELAQNLVRLVKSKIFIAEEFSQARSNTR